jgi:DNA-binding MarR family transcriptional regulator
MQIQTSTKGFSVSSAAESVRLFNRFYTRVLGLLNEGYLNSPVSLSEARILFEVNDHPKCRAKDLIEMLGMDRGYMSRTLRRLERQGWILREKDPQDKRARGLTLTAQGQMVLKTLIQNSSSLINSLISPLNQEEIQQLVSAMELIQSLLSKNQEQKPS